jgi:ubiquinone/menaquinone biosynthesis C-methylase UbiE
MENSNSAVERIFNRLSEVYDHPIPQKLFYGRIQQQLLNEIKDHNPKHILDAGCGTGELMHKMASIWPKSALVGVDLSEDMLAVAESKDYGSAKKRFICGSVYDIPLDDEKFDLITNTISSHFYTRIDQALSEFHRLLKPGGHLLMANLTNGALGVLPGPFRKGIRLPAQTYRSKNNWIQHLENSGFEIVKVKRLPYPAQLFVCQK